MDLNVETGAAADQLHEVIAVSAAEVRQWGCPRCGYRSGSHVLSVGRCATWRCGGCERTCITLADGITKSTIGIGLNDGDDFVFPELQDHPRRGTPSHGRSDVVPKKGGEHFRSRGIGLDSGLTCFVCGGSSSGYLKNIAAFVNTKEAGERVVALFDAFNGGARLDYREHSPDRVQVKVGACGKHGPHLKKLDLLCEDGRITSDRIAAAAQ